MNPPSLLGAKIYGTRCAELEIRNCGTYENGPSTLTPQMRYKRLQDPPLAQVKRRYSGGWWLVQSNVKAKCGQQAGFSVLAAGAQAAGRPLSPLAGGSSKDLNLQCVIVVGIPVFLHVHVSTHATFGLLVGRYQTPPFGCGVFLMARAFRSQIATMIHHANMQMY